MKKNCYISNCWRRTCSSSDGAYFCEKANNCDIQNDLIIENNNCSHNKETKNILHNENEISSCSADVTSLPSKVSL